MNQTEELFSCSSPRVDTLQKTSSSEFCPTRTFPHHYHRPERLIGYISSPANRAALVDHSLRIQTFKLTRLSFFSSSFSCLTPPPHSQPHSERLMRLLDICDVTSTFWPICETMLTRKPGTLAAVFSNSK